MRPIKAQQGPKLKKNVEGALGERDLGGRRRKGDGDGSRLPLSAARRLFPIPPRRFSSPTHQRPASHSPLLSSQSLIPPLSYRIRISTTIHHLLSAAAPHFLPSPTATTSVCLVSPPPSLARRPSTLLLMMILGWISPALLRYLGFILLP